MDVAVSSADDGEEVDVSGGGEVAASGGGTAVLADVSGVVEAVLPEAPVSVDGVEEASEVVLELEEVSGGTEEMTFTVRDAVPVTPFWSVALYIIVCVPGLEVSTEMSETGVEVAPSTDAVMPRLRSAVGPVMCAPRSLYCEPI